MAEMNSSVFCFITRRDVVWDRRFETTYRGYVRYRILMEKIRVEENNLRILGCSNISETSSTRDYAVDRKLSGHYCSFRA